jgi:hypothetical protein
MRPLRRPAGTPRAIRRRAAAVAALGLALAAAGCGPGSQPGSSLTAPYGHSGRPPAYFRTLPVGATLPSSSECARWVRARPIAENKGMNIPYNQTKGQHVASNFLASDEPQADQQIVPRINGNFTGTTGEILRWAACKWGISQDIVFAQAAVESWWRQTQLGDWHTTGCPPGHGLGVDGTPGLCPQSWGILQNRYPYEQSSWPAIATSTAMNADTAYAVWRSCYDGYETWLNTVPHVGTYQAGNVWGCVGRWDAGRWFGPQADEYIAKVKRQLRRRVWTQPYFQQP